MAAPADLKVTWVGPPNTGVTKRLFPATVISTGVTLGLVDFGDPFDSGTIEFSRFEEPRVMQDGLFYYGGVFSAAREIVLPLHVQADTAARAMDFMQTLDFWFNHSARGTLRIERKNAAGASLLVQAKGVAGKRRSFSSHPSSAEMFYGRADSGRVAVLQTIICDDPHFRTLTPVTGGMSTAGTDTVTLANPSPNRVGVLVGITVAEPIATAAVTIRNLTTGRYVAVGTPTWDGSVWIDWFSTPDNLAVYREFEDETIDLMENINVGACLWAEPGNNEFKVEADTGDVTANVIFYPAYDSI